MKLQKNIGTYYWEWIGKFWNLVEILVMVSWLTKKKCTCNISSNHYSIIKFYNVNNPMNKKKKCCYSLTESVGYTLAMYWNLWYCVWYD